MGRGGGGRVWVAGRWNDKERKRALTRYGGNPGEETSAKLKVFV